MHQHTVHKLVLGEMQCKCLHAGCLSGPPACMVVGCSSGGGGGGGEGGGGGGGRDQLTMQSLGSRNGIYIKQDMNCLCYLRVRRRPFYSRLL